MIELGSRCKAQPPPPEFVFEALVDPHRDLTRPWLDLLADEHEPQIVSATPHTAVTWSSLWPHRPDVQVRFELQGNARGTSVRWVLESELPYDESAVGHMRKRVNTLINANLRYSFGQ